MPSSIKKYDKFVQPAVQEETRTTIGSILSLVFPVLCAGYFVFILVYFSSEADPLRSTTLTSTSGKVSTARFVCEAEECLISSVFGFWVNDEDNHPSSLACRTAGASFGCTFLKHGDAVDVPLCNSNSNLDGVYTIYYDSKINFDHTASIPGVNRRRTGSRKNSPRRRSRSPKIDTSPPLEPISVSMDQLKMMPIGTQIRKQTSNDALLRTLKPRNFNDNPLSSTTETPTPVTEFDFGHMEGFSVISDESRVPLTYFSNAEVTYEELIYNENVWRATDNKEVDTKNLYIHQTSRPLSSSVFEYSQLNFVDVGFGKCQSPTMAALTGNDRTMFEASMSKLSMNEFAINVRIERPTIYVTIISQMGGFISLVMQFFGIIVAIRLYMKKTTGKLQDDEEKAIAKRLEREDVVRRNSIDGPVTNRDADNIFETSDATDDSYDYETTDSTY